MTEELIHLRNTLANARLAVTDALIDVWAANANHAEAKTRLEASAAQARAEGRIEGKNEADREAHARTLFVEAYDNLDTTAADLATAKSILERARNRLDELRDEIRLHEISVAIQRDFAAAA